MIENNLLNWLIFVVILIEKHVFLILLYYLSFIYMDDNEEFEVGDAGSSMFDKTDSNRLKPGSLVMIKGNPCKVTDVSTAKPGKHGSAKVILKGKDILTAKTYECTYHAGDMVDAPIVKRTEYTLLNIEEDQL